MQNFFKKFSLFLIFLFLGITKVSADTIESIEMDVYINPDGNANITEIWKTNFHYGTEMYKNYKDLRNSIISNFIVSDETGTQYEAMSKWNPYNNFQTKAFKNGIYYNGDEVELCWGISNYGNKTYTLKYEFSNFVEQYTDNQGIDFNFLNLEQKVDNVKINIHSDIPFSVDNAKIWAFGYNGTINFVNGNIVLESNGALSSNEYIVGLIKFEENLFNTNSFLNKSFNDAYNEAMSTVKTEKFFQIILYILIFSLTVFPIIGLIYLWFLSKRLYKESKELEKERKLTEMDFSMAPKKLPKDNEIPYYREIPCGKNLAKAYWISKQYNIVSKEDLECGIIGAILLKWLKEKKICVIEKKEKIFLFNFNSYAIKLLDNNDKNNEAENKLFEILKEAANNNQILEENELSSWCQKNYIKILSWFVLIFQTGQKTLENEGLIISEPKVMIDYKGEEKKYCKRTVTENVRKEAINLKGLKKFLLHFSTISNKEHFQVHIWEEYLIFAHLLGIADKVEKEFKELYPDFYKTSTAITNNDLVIIKSFSTSSYRGYSSNFNSSSYSSGSGGSSFSSGGSSSRGSSGGGVR